MSSRHPSSFTAEDLSDPSIDKETLAQIAEHRPELRVAVRQHPNCYAELARWIDGLMPPAPPAPVQAKPTADEWAAAFQNTHGREPSMSEYQNAVAKGELRRSQDASVQQIAEGAKQLANGAKEFLTNRVVPAAADAARQVQQVANSHPSTSGPGMERWVARAPFILPAASFVAILSLFLPIASMMGMSVNFFSDEAGGEGGALLVLFLLTIAGSVAAVMVRAKWSRITGGILGVIAGLFGMFDGFGNMVRFGGESGVSVGFGLVLLALSSVVVIAASVLLLIGLRTKPVQQELDSNA